MHKIFRYPNFSKTLKGVRQETFRYCETKNSEQKFFFAENIEISGGINACREPSNIRF